MVVFGTIFGVGFLILLINLIFGGDADVDADVDLDAGGGSHGPGIFNLKMLSLFAVGFGAVGFGARVTTDWTMLQSSMAGLGGAVVVGLLGYLILRLFYASQTTSTINDRDLIGLTGNVVDTITSTGYGQVSCVVRGREITFLARSGDGQEIARRTPVRIESKSGDVVTVTTLGQ